MIVFKYEKSFLLLLYKFNSLYVFINKITYKKLIKNKAIRFKYKNLIFSFIYLFSLIIKQLKIYKLIPY